MPQAERHLLQLGRINNAPLLLVSPHAGDAWLSCAALLLRTEPVNVLTVFAGAPDRPLSTEGDLRRGFGDSAQAVAAQREEEREAFADTPHRLELMDLVRADYLDGPVAERGVERVTLVARDWLRTRPEGVVIAPVGAGARGRAARAAAWARRRARIGPDADSVTLRDALVRSVPPRSLVLYEEFPRRLGGRGDGPARRIGALRGEFFARVDVPIDRHAKAAALSAYRSWQRSPAHDLTDPTAPEALAPRERYWLPTP